VNDAEDGRVGADAEGQRGHDHDGEHGLVHETPSRVSKVLRESGHRHLGATVGAKRSTV
jgi:hypothetical protein